MTADPRSVGFGGERWLTDSRVYNLVWLGRWIERAYGICRSIEVASAAEGETLGSLAAAWGVVVDDANSPADGLRALFLICITNARDDAAQVGPLELIEVLNLLREDFPALWGSPGSASEMRASASALLVRLDDVTAVIEERWFHPIGA